MVLVSGTILDTSNSREHYASYVSPKTLHMDSLDGKYRNQINLILEKLNSIMSYETRDRLQFWPRTLSDEGKINVTFKTKNEITTAFWPKNIPAQYSVTTAKFWT